MECKETTTNSFSSLREKDFPNDLFQLAGNKLQGNCSTFTPQAFATTYQTPTGTGGQDTQSQQLEYGINI